jgi:hypothetical protein
MRHSNVQDIALRPNFDELLVHLSLFKLIGARTILQQFDVFIMCLALELLKLVVGGWLADFDLKVLAHRFFRGEKVLAAWPQILVQVSVGEVRRCM